MASNPEDPRKSSQTTAKGATATTSMAGAGASTAAKTAAKPAAGAGTLAAPSKARAATTPPNKNDPQTDAPPDWDALRAEVIKNSPKVKVVQITGPIDMLKVLIANRDEQASTTYIAHPRKSASQDNNKNNRTVPAPKL